MRTDGTYKSVEEYCASNRDGEFSEIVRGTDDITKHKCSELRSDPMRDGRGAPVSLENSTQPCDRGMWCAVESAWRAYFFESPTISPIDEYPHP